MPKGKARGKKTAGVSPRVLDDLFSTKLEKSLDRSIVRSDTLVDELKKVARCKSFLYPSIVPPKRVRTTPFTRFGEWFKAQFPVTDRQHRVSGDARRRMMDYLDDKKRLTRTLEAELELVERAHELYDAALKGWVAGYEAGKYEALKGKK